MAFRTALPFLGLRIGAGPSTGSSGAAVAVAGAGVADIAVAAGGVAVAVFAWGSRSSFDGGWNTVAEYHSVCIY